MASYWILIASITLHGGETIEKKITSASTKTLCNDIAKEPIDYLPQIYLKPIEGEKSRVYECREGK